MDVPYDIIATPVADPWVLHGHKKTPTIDVRVLGTWFNLLVNNFILIFITNKTESTSIVPLNVDSSHVIDSIYRTHLIREDRILIVHLDTLNPFSFEVFVFLTVYFYVTHDVLV
jgi:hypothetical protein